MDARVNNYTLIMNAQVRCVFVDVLKRHLRVCRCAETAIYPLLGSPILSQKASYTFVDDFGLNCLFEDMLILST